MRSYDFFGRVATDTGNWLTQRFMAPIPWQEWGWEYWWQIEFPAWLDASQGAAEGEQYDFRREVTIEGAGVRVDWLINSLTTTSPVAVNLKAQTVKSIQSSFLNSVNEDIQKLKRLPKDIPAVMMVAVIDAGTEQELIRRGFIGISGIQGTVSILFQNIAR